MISKMWLPLLFVLLLSFAINNTINAGVTAEDWTRHIVWINSWIAGNPVPLSVYPPAFHWFMILPVLLFGANIAWFQVVLAAAVNAVLLWFVHKYHGYTATLVLAVLMLSNLTFLMYYDSLTPQTLDIILFPLFAYFLLNNKPIYATGILVFMGYMHDFGFMFYGVAFIYSLAYKREYLKYFIVAALLLTPVLYFKGITLVNALITPNHYFDMPNVKSVAFQLWATEETLYFQQPINLLAFNGFVLPMLIYAIYKLRKQFKLSAVQKFYIVWIICFMPAMYFSIYRTMSYIIIPMMLLESSVIKNVL